MIQSLAGIKCLPGPSKGAVMSSLYSGDAANFSTSCACVFSAFGEGSSEGERAA